MPQKMPFRETSKDLIFLHNFTYFLKKLWRVNVMAAIALITEKLN